MIKISKKQILGLIAGIIIFAIIYFVFIYDKDYLEKSSDIDALSNYIENNSEEEKETKNEIIESEQSEDKIKVYITGEIKKSGVYEIEEKSRIADLIELAGGITKQADIEKINLAFILEDGMKVYIPNKKEKTNLDSNLISGIDSTEIYVSKEIDEKYVSGGKDKIEATSDERKTNDTKRVNINTASQTELQNLPGIGPSTAEKIINYRKENGKFSSINDIKKVKGIGEAKFNKIKELIFV